METLLAILYFVLAEVISGVFIVALYLVVYLVTVPLYFTGEVSLWVFTLGSRKVRFNVPTPGETADTGPAIGGSVLIGALICAVAVTAWILWR